MSAVFAIAVLKGSRGLMRSQQLYVPSVRERLVVLSTPFPLSLRGVASILPIIGKIVVAGNRRKNPARR